MSTAEVFSPEEVTLGQKGDNVAVSPVVQPENASPVEGKKVLKSDLLPVMSVYWDTQMLLPVLLWLEERQIYSADDIGPMRDLVFSSCMMTEEKKAEAMKISADLEYYLQSYFAALVAYKKDQQNRMGSVAERKTIQELSEWCSKSKFTKDVKEEFLPFAAGLDEKLLYLAKLYYGIGDYKNAKRHLDFYVSHVMELTTEGADHNKKLSCYWGIVASIILFHSGNSILDGGMGPASSSEYPGNPTPDQLFSAENMKVEEGVQCLLKLVDLIDNSSFESSKKITLLQRSWVIHWAVWPLMRYYLLNVYVEDTPMVSATWTSLIDTIFAENNTAVVQLVCPHMLRYYSVYCILNRKRKDHFQTLLQLISHAKPKYSDSFTLLLEALYVEFNFEAAQGHMADISKICATDFFLEPLKSAIEEHSRLLIFEIYCRIHRSINLDMIAYKLNLPSDVAQRWIVNLIRNEKLEAKIDSEKNRLEMTASSPSIYQQIIDRTRSLAFDSSVINQNFVNYLTSGRYEGDHRDGSYGNRGMSRGRSGMRGGRGAGGDDEDGGRHRGGGRGRHNTGGQGGGSSNYKTHTGQNPSRDHADDAFWD